MSDPLTSPRRFRFGLRSLFVLVTVVSMVTAWVAYSLNWKRQRYALLEGAFPEAHGDYSATAPGGLWVFGESGHFSILLHPYEPETIERTKRLFPESKVIKWYRNKAPIEGDY